MTSVPTTAQQAVAPVREVASGRRTAEAPRSAPTRTGAAVQASTTPVVNRTATTVRSAASTVRTTPQRAVTTVRSTSERAAETVRTASKRAVETAARLPVSQAIDAVAAVPQRVADERTSPLPASPPAGDRTEPRHDTAATGRVAGVTAAAANQQRRDATVLTASAVAPAEAPSGWRSRQSGATDRPQSSPVVPDSQPGTVSAASAGAAATAIFGLLALLIIAAPQMSSAVRLRTAFAPLAPFRALSERPG